MARNRLALVHGRWTRVSLWIAALSAPSAAQTSAWNTTIGTPAGEVRAIASDQLDGVLVAARLSPVAGPTLGGDDVVLRRFTPVGAQDWSVQLGGSHHDWPNASWRDAANGFVVAGGTYGDFGGAPFGESDGWVARVDASGSVLWRRQLGTVEYDDARAGCSSGAEMFVAGVTNGAFAAPNAGSNDVWLLKLASDGSELWRRQLGSFELDMVGAAVSDGSGGVYLVGATDAGDIAGAIGDWDAWVAHYDSSGTLLWTRQLGTLNNDEANAAASDEAGGLIVAGVTEGDITGTGAPFGGFDVWAARLNAQGALLWTRQLGSSDGDQLAACTRDGEGGAYLIGSTEGALAGFSNGMRDTFTVRLDASGAIVWQRQGATPDDETALRGAWDGGRGFYMTYIEQIAGGASDLVLRREYASLVQRYCTSSTTTHGCVPRLDSAGSPSLGAASGFVLSASSVEGQRLGLVFYGVSNSGFTPLPWGAGSSSFLCVRPPTQRASPSNSGGAPNQCNGVLALDWLAYVAATPTALGAPFSSGESIYAQAWFRDPSAPRGTNLSDALSFTVLP